MGKHCLLNNPLACVCVLRYGSYIFVRCFCDFTSCGRKLTKSRIVRTGIYCASGLTGADGSCTTPDDPIEPKERHRPAISSSEGKRDCAVGIKLQVWEQVREQMQNLACEPDPQMLSIKRTAAKGSLPRGQGADA